MLLLLYLAILLTTTLLVFLSSAYAVDGLPNVAAVAVGPARVVLALSP